MKNFTLFVLSVLLSAKIFSQCPASMTASAATTPAACPSNGTAVITTSPAANSSFFYSIVSAPVGIALNVPQSSNTFNALLPGDYTAKVTCGGTETTVSFTIADAYTPLTVDAVATPNCGTFSPGGMVSIATVGGTAPLSYSIIQSNDPNYPDAQSVYNSSPVKTVSSYGTYQVRVKDACNQFYTKSIIVKSPVLPMEAHALYVGQEACGSDRATIGIYLYDPASGTYGDIDDYNANGGLKIRVWEQASSGSCGPAGPLLYETVFSSGTEIFSFPITVSKKYYVQTITACGDTSAYCTDATGLMTPGYSAFATTKGCTGNVSNPPAMNIRDNSDVFMIYPIQVTIRNSAGVVVFTYTLTSYIDEYVTPDLPMDTYAVTAVDACGNTVEQVINNPAAAGPPGFSFVWYDSNACLAGGTTQEGTTTAWLAASGYQEDHLNTTITIISGPSNVGVQATPSVDQWVWANILPGTYVIRVTTSCGTADYTVTVNPTPDKLYHRSITAVSNSSCGGGGSIVSGVESNTTAQNVFELVNTASGMVVATNLNGSFSNVAPGSYFVKMGYTRCDGSIYYINSNTVTIASGTGPQIVKKMGVTCEDAGGNPLTTGTAYLSFAGASPLLVEYKLAGASSWNTYSADSPADIAISGLASGSIYDIRVTSCGITAASQVTIEQMGTIPVLTPSQPCNNQSYELRLPQLSGAAYEWKNPSGVVVSINYNYAIGNYNNSYNGQYTGRMTWSGCLNRSATITLNSALCGLTTLPVKLISFDAKAGNCVTLLTWKTGDETTIKQFIIERSADGKQYTAIGTMGNGETGNLYTYTDSHLLQGVVYYRIRITDNDGRFVFSKSLAVSMQCNAVSTNWHLFPSIIQRGTGIKAVINSKEEAKTVAVTIVNAAGQKVNHQYITILKGTANYTIPTGGLSEGTYIVTMYGNNGVQIGESKKFVLTK